MEDGEFIEIANDLTTVYTRQIQRQVPTEEFLERFEIVAPYTYESIARSQVFAHIRTSGDTETHYVMTEIPAGIQNIIKNLRNNTARRYRLGMPWTYIWYVIQGNRRNNSWSIQNYKAFHARSRYDGNINFPMIVARLPNLSSDGTICWGGTGVSPNLKIADRLDQLTNEFYDTRFNSDLDGSVALPYGEPNYARWVSETAENASSWMAWPEFNSADQIVTIKDLLDENQQIARPTNILLPDSIPDIPVNMTFGTWDEWWMRQIPAQERTRARISLENIEFDDPDNLPPVTETEIRTEILNDGGIEVPFRR